VTWNSARDIDACIDSLNFGHEFEVVVVDNSSADSTAELVRQHHHVRLVANSANLGYARANNQGIALAQGEYVLLLNPDTVVALGALDRLSDYLDAHADAGAAAPRLLNPDGTSQKSIRSFPTTGSVLYELTGLARLLPGNCGTWKRRDFNYEITAEVEQPMASCLMVRKAVFDRLGGLDEGFPIFYNDVDLSKRMADAGWKTVYLPDARVVHARGASTSQVKPRMVWEAHRSLFRYLHKHDRSGLFWLKAIVLLPLLELSALVRVLAWRLRLRRRG
jgi:GT2 family glycosyltransferase